MLNFITNHRFNYLDMVFFSIALQLLFQHKYAMGIAVGFIGSTISVILELFSEKRQTAREEAKLAAMKERQWQEIAQQEGKLIDAIKMHRQLYGCGLKDSVDVVRPYYYKVHGIES